MGDTALALRDVMPALKIKDRDAIMAPADFAFGFVDTAHIA
jgi:hypothetical protein